VRLDLNDKADSDLRVPIPQYGEIPLDLQSFILADGILEESLLAQWLVTKWLAARAASAKFTVQGNRTGTAALQQLMETHPGRLLALLPVGAVAGASTQAAAVLRDKIVREQVGWPGLPMESATALYCIDGHPSGLPTQLYSNKELADWDGFRVVVNGLVGIIGSNRTPSARFLDRANSIANILFELFKNTHEHARAGIEYEVLGYSVRGLYARYYDPDHLRRQFPSSRDELMSMRLSPAEVYTWSLLQQESTRSRRQSSLADSGVLEISVFDSGPGLAARWHGADTRQLAVSQELDFVLSCLAKGQSTSNRPAKGFGLWNVLQELRALRGFVRIRTNRIHMFREFNVARDAALQTDGGLSGTPKEMLFDWKKRVVTSASECPPIAGTLISVLLPLGGQA
jgi:hypothetical protein